jgi:ATP-dependent RNA helicase MSS116
MSAMPPRKTHPRQSLLFSATIPPGIREVADLDPNHVVVNTLKPGEENTHEHVPQEYLLVSSVDMFPATVSILEQSFANDPTSSKVILFFATARLTGLFYALMEKMQAQGDNPLAKVPLFELHSRKSQSTRIKASKEFGAAIKGILCSSDVTARGVDFPGVTQVVQVGLPASGEQYIHRLGRTARKCSRGRLT